MTSIPAYTLSRLMTRQAVIQRDQSEPDSYGADRAPVWADHVTVPCAFWWDKATGTHSANRTMVNVSRDVPVSAGGMLIPSGTDVTEDDRILRLLNPDGSVWVEGIFTIIAVLNEYTHMEVDVERTSLGA